MKPSKLIAFLKTIGFFAALLPLSACAKADFVVYDDFDYFDTNSLADGSANLGVGWTEGWQALSGGGLKIQNRRIDQTAAAASCRGIAEPLSLSGSDDYYFAFFARAEPSGTFSLSLTQASSGSDAGWTIKRDENGTLSIQAGGNTQTSSAGMFPADKEYLVVSKFDGSRNTASVKLIDPNAPGDYLIEPTEWDLSATGSSRLTIDQLNIEAAGGVKIDDVVIAGSYAEVMRFMASEVPELLTPAEGASSPYAFPNFSWTPHREHFREMDALVNYEIEIATDAAFDSVIDQDIVGLARYVHSHPLAEGVYFWRVRSLTAGGRVTEWSDVGSFEIAAYDRTVTVDYDPRADDHTAAVLAAVAETATLAAQGHSVKLVFPEGDYHFGDKSVGTLIDLPGVNNVAVEGTGANLNFISYRQSLMSAEASSFVSLSGFRIYYALGALRIQGTVKAVDPDTSTVTLAVEPGFKDFGTATIRPRDIFLLLDPEIDGRQKDGSVSFYRAARNGYSQNPDGSWQVQLDRNSTPEWEVGDRFVYHFRGGSPPVARFHDSHSVTYYGLALGGWGNMLVYSYQGSLINVLHIDTFYQEGQWMIGNADGIHIRGHAVGPWIENTRIEGLGDDGMALYARPASMRSAKPDGRQNAAIFVDNFFNLEPGDEVSFFEPLPGTILLETRVVSVTQQGNDWLVEFENDLPDGMNFDADGRLVEITQVWNRSKSCGDFMVRNSRFINNRRYATVFRSQRGIIENTQIVGASHRSIVFTNGTQFPNGLYASEIILRNNRIADSGFVSNYPPAIGFWFRSQGGRSPTSIGPRNILIKDNLFSDVRSPEIGLNNTGNVLVWNNRVLGDSSLRDAQLNSVRSERIVTRMDEVISDRNPPSAPTGLEASTARNGVRLQWDLGSDPNVVRFRVYRSRDGGRPTLVKDDLFFSEYLDLDVRAGSTYFYAVTAMDIEGNEGSHSDSARILWAEE